MCILVKPDEDCDSSGPRCFPLIIGLLVSLASGLDVPFWISSVVSELPASSTPPQSDTPLTLRWPHSWCCSSWSQRKTLFFSAASNSPKPVKTVFLRHYCPQVGQASTSTCLSARLSEPDVVTAASYFLSFSRETPEASQLTNSAQHTYVAPPLILAWLMWLLIYCIEEVLFVGPSVDLCDQLDLPAFWKMVESVAVVLPFETLDGWIG